MGEETNSFLNELLMLAWEPATIRRYEQLVEEFERAMGLALSGITNAEDVVRRLMEHAAELVRTGRSSRALTAIAAVAWRTKLATGTNIYKDKRVGALVKAITKFRGASGDMKEKRDALPVPVVISFASRRPPGWEEWEYMAARAMICVGVRCIRRPGELADWREDELRADAPLGERARMRVRFSKTDPAGAGTTEVPFERGRSAACPIRCLDEYLRMAKGVGLGEWNGRRPSSAHVFVKQNGQPYTTADIKNMVRAVARSEGAQGNFGGHSIRITGACLAAAGGMTIEQIMTIGGWRSRAVEHYLRAQIAVELGASARMAL